jgi:hypothetical protein
MGAVLALPLLESMTPRVKAQESLAKPPLRTAFFFMPNGVNVSRWKPAGDGAGTIRSSRRIRSAPETPMCNLHLALLERMGVKRASFGDSNGVLALS